jgi:hypothetical protein
VIAGAGYAGPRIRGVQRAGAGRHPRQQEGRTLHIQGHHQPHGSARDQVQPPPPPFWSFPPNAHRVAKSSFFKCCGLGSGLIRNNFFLIFFIYPDLDRSLI